MTRAPRNEEAPKVSPAPTASRWAALTWDHLEQWAGGRSVSRGKAYQRQGRVRNLAVAEDGRLLATVEGGDRYTVSVWLKSARAKGESVESTCTCPVGNSGCKHAVAVVADYLDHLAGGREVPAAAPSDPRWARLESAGDTELDTDGDEDIDELLEEAEDLGEAELPAPGKPRKRKEWDDKIRQHVSAKSREELIELVVSLTDRFPELREEFRERIALGEGDVDRLVAEARRELRKVTAEPGWRNHWEHEGYTPDFSRLQKRLERMVEMGKPDAVVPLGRELIERGLRQIEQSHDEGETAMALTECLPVVFKAVAQSSLPAPRKLLFAIDAYLRDEYDAIGEAADAVLEAKFKPADWSAVAEELAARLHALPGGGADFSGNYRRDRVSNWLADALHNAGRSDEVLALYESEARATASYERLVRLLIQEKRYDDVQRWATEGIEKTHDKLPGIASHLVQALGEVARSRRQWDVVAAHAACEFFAHPSPETFKQLVSAAAKTDCQEAVRLGALRFLETGVAPLPPAAPRATEGKPAAAPAWPLPVPDYLRPLLKRPSPDRTVHGPYYEVLIDLAIAQKRPEDVLKWYDQMVVGRKRSRDVGLGYGWNDLGDRVAAAVAHSHPERALEIYSQRVAANLPEPHPAAYEAVAGYLRKMRPILKSIGREDEWTRVLADIRLQYGNRPRFMEILDRLDGRTIVQTRRTRR